MTIEFENEIVLTSELSIVSMSPAAPTYLRLVIVLVAYLLSKVVVPTTVVVLTVVVELLFTLPKTVITRGTLATGMCWF